MTDSNPSNGCSNRVKLCPTHATFRLLCHASRVGAIIGKSGVLIKTLQEATAAKIRIEDALPESPDRVILVTASTATSAAGEVSKAQEALLKVFERVLDAAAETAGTEVGDRVVSCRLLADTSQVGAVIGKAGKVVEKIRIDTGCKIRVLTDGLPACTAPSDEIIEVSLFVSAFRVLARCIGTLQLVNVNVSVCDVFARILAFVSSWILKLKFYSLSCLAEELLVIYLREACLIYVILFECMEWMSKL